MYWEQLGARIQNCALLTDFLTVFCYTTHSWLYEKTMPAPIYDVEKALSLDKSKWYISKFQEWMYMLLSSHMMLWSKIYGSHKSHSSWLYFQRIGHDLFTEISYVYSKICRLMCHHKNYAAWWKLKKKQNKK